MSTSAVITDEQLARALDGLPSEAPEVIAHIGEPLGEVCSIFVKEIN